LVILAACSFVKVNKSVIFFAMTLTCSQVGATDPDAEHFAY